MINESTVSLCMSPPKMKSPYRSIGKSPVVSDHNQSFKRGP